jgi:Flp pilus assembly protein protease CpaA
MPWGQVGIDAGGSAMFTLTLFPVLTIYAAFSDLLTMTIPNRVSLLLVAGFVPVALMAGLSAPTFSFISRAAPWS